MEKIYIVTYATHSDGLFEKLINNKFNIKIDIIGWNTKFSYIDKINNLLNYIDNKSDNDIIVYLDGFDTLININYKNNELLKLFLEYKTKILFSEDPINLLLIDNKLIGKELYNINFGKYNDNIKPSMGMFMGYVKDLKILFKCMIKQNLEDDQKALSKCYLSNMKIDKYNKIFLNTKYYYYDNNRNDINSIFISFPFGFTNTEYDNKRLTRFIFVEKKKFIIILLLLISIFFIILFIKKFFKKIKTRYSFFF